MEPTYADQHAHDVTWMTAAEREAYERRLAWQVRYLAAVAREKRAAMRGYLDSHAGL